MISTITNLMKRSLLVPPLPSASDRVLQTSSSNSFSTSIAKLTAKDQRINNYFGDTNALAISKNRIVVGASGYANGRGAAYLFMDPINSESGKEFSQIAMVLASNGVSGDAFGTSIDIDGDIIVIGGSGSMYVYRIAYYPSYGEYNVIPVTTLQAYTQEAQNTGIGGSVAIHGNFILVGDETTDSAFLFVNLSNDESTPQWTQTMQFLPDDNSIGTYFGSSVAIYRSIAVIATREYSANEVFVFEPVDKNDNLSSWTQTAKLTGSNGDVFGFSVALTENWIVVGAVSAVNTIGISVGAVFAFTKTQASSSSWSQMTKLLASDGSDHDRFGSSVAVSEDATTIVVGAMFDELDSNIEDAGAAYLFRTPSDSIPAGEWTQVEKFVADDPAVYGQLGYSIAIDNALAVVGATGAASATGAVYVLDTGFTLPTTKPTVRPSSMPTIMPTAKPTTNAPTPNPTVSPTQIVTNAPTTLAPSTIAPTMDHVNSSPSAPPTSSPSLGPMLRTKSERPTTKNPTNPPPTTEQPIQVNSIDTTTSDNSGIIIAAIIGAVVVVIVLGYFHFRRKGQSPEPKPAMNTGDDPNPLIFQSQPPTTTFGNNHMHATDTPANEATMILADAVLVSPAAQPIIMDQTLEAEAFIDPATRGGTATTSAESNSDTSKNNNNTTEKELPNYKDQVHAAAPLPRSPPPL